MSWIKLALGSAVVSGVLLSASSNAGAAECSDSISITTVQYVGRDDGKDRFLVKWNKTDSTSQCVVSTLLKLKFEITRRLGKKESVVKTLNPDTTDTILILDRGALETDPESYKLTLEAKQVTPGTTSSTANFTASGPPVAAGLSINSSSSSACLPKFQIYKVGFITNESTKDVVEAFWSVSVQPECATLKEFRVRVELTRSNGEKDIKTVTVASSVLGTRVDLPKGGAVTQSVVRVSAHVEPQTPLLVVTKNGNF